MSIREQIFRHMEAIEASGDISSLNAAIWAWLGEVDETDHHLTLLEQKLAASRAALLPSDEDAEIISSLNAAIWAWLGEVDETDHHLTLLEQKLAASRAALLPSDEDAEIDTSIGFEPLTKEQRLQRLDERWARYQQTGRTVSQAAMKSWAAGLPVQQ